MITEVQRQNRMATIGSSDAAAILGLNPYASAWDVYAEKTGLATGARPESEAIDLGNAMEEHLLDWAIQRLELTGLRRDEVLVHPVHPLFVSNADGVGERGSKRVGLEAKTAGLVGPLVGEWGEEWSPDVPDHYFIQCQFQMACGGMEGVYMPVLLGGRGRIMYYVPRNDHTISIMEPALLKFWDEHVLAGVPPVNSRPSPETIKRIMRVAAKSVDMPANVVAAWESAKKARLDAAKVEEACKAEMLGRLGDAEEGRVSDGRLLTYYETKRDGYTVAPCAYRTPRIKKGRSNVANP